MPVRFSKTPLLGFLIAPLIIAGCQIGQPTIRHITDPSEFGRNIFRIAEEGNAREWGTQMTIERRAMGDEYIEKHFERWRKDLLALKQAFGMPIDQVKFRVAEGNGLEFEQNEKWFLLFRVSNEEGGWKINQD
jgi:hypothetical protein